LAFHPSAQRLAIGSGNRLQLVELDAVGKETRRRKLGSDLYVVIGTGFTPNGQHLGATTFGPGAYLLDGEDLKQIAFTPSPEELFGGLSFSADGKRMAFAKKFQGAQELMLWEPRSGKPPRSVARETGTDVISAVAFAPGGRQIAHGGTHGGPIKLQDIVSGQSDSYATGGHGNLNALAFSPDGTLLAATFSDGSVVVWDVVAEKDEG
jgi:WD40 repeat protein